jgi:dethiobiotin synthetase
MGQIIFITGTDTGVGKTLLAALLLAHLRSQDCHVLAMKPFCSGGLDDVEILYRIQKAEISMERISPFHFEEPVAPLVAARRSGRSVTLSEAIRQIVKLARECELLLVEGAGGLFVPLGEAYTMADLIKALHCPVLLVVRNRLGAINHTLLTLNALRALSVSKTKIVLMEAKRTSLASATNLELLKELSVPDPVFRIPFLGQNASRVQSIIRAAKKLKKTLAQIAGTAIVSTASLKVAGKSAKRAKKKVLA